MELPLWSTSTHLSSWWSDSCCCLGFCIISSGRHINSLFSSYWGEEIKLFCPPGIWLFTLFFMFSSLVNKAEDLNILCVGMWSLTAGPWKCWVPHLWKLRPWDQALGSWCLLKLSLLRGFPCKVAVLLFPSPMSYYSSDSADTMEITWFSCTASVLVLSTLRLLE